MSEKYTTLEDCSSLPRTITSDRFLAAYLLSRGFELVKVVENERQRVSFVFVGEGVKDEKRAYRKQRVMVDMNAFRVNFNQVSAALWAKKGGKRHVPSSQYRVPATQ